MQNFNEKFTEMEKIPTSLLKEITVNDVEEMTGNTNSPLSSISGQTGDNILNDFGKYNGQEQTPINAPGVTQNAGSLITADMAVNFAEMIIPAALVLLFKNAMNKTVSKKQFSLNSAEKETIKPVLQNYLNSINFRIENPANALLFTVVMIYGVKVFEVIQDMPNGTFTPNSKGAQDIGQPTAQGTIKKDGRGRPRKKQKINIL